MTTKKPAVIYIRVSTARQAEEGVSLDAQLERARLWCKFNGCEIVSEHRDSGISGKKMSTRPGLLSALEDACRLKAVLVVYSLSRLARSTRDALAISDRLSRAGADLASLTENIDTTSAAGKMIFRILAVLAEFERDVISERTRSALSYKRGNGQKTGGVMPYGYWSRGEDGQLVRDEREQAVITEMLVLHSAGKKYTEIARALNDRGIQAKQGGRWSAKVVRGVIAAAQRWKELA